MEEWRIDTEDPESVLNFICTSCSTSGSKKIICVDYFDTVVTRTVVPEHTKEMASAALSQSLKGALSGSQLYQFRRDLELVMTNSNADEQGELDFYLPDFARRFWLLLQEKIPSFFPWGTRRFCHTPSQYRSCSGKNSADSLPSDASRPAGPEEEGFLHHSCF